MQHDGPMYDSNIVGRAETNASKTMVGLSTFFARRADFRAAQVWGFVVPCSAVCFRGVQCGAVWCCVVLCDGVQCCELSANFRAAQVWGCVVLCSAVCFGVVQCGAVRCTVVQCVAVWYCVVQCGAVQCCELSANFRAAQVCGSVLLGCAVLCGVL